MSEWISVASDLPRDGKDYQVFCRDTREQFVAFYRGDGRWQFGRYKDSVTDVQLLCTPTHWMELPEPPL